MNLCTHRVAKFMNHKGNVMPITSISRAGLLAALIAGLLLNAAAQSTDTQTGQASPTDSADRTAQRAVRRVDDALAVVRQMEAEPRMRQWQRQAKGVLIIPAYGRAALGVGAHGGAGVLLLRQPDDSWSAAKGLFGDAVAVGLNDIRFNQEMTNAYYGRGLSPRDIAAGNVSNPQSQPLQQALAAAVTRVK